MKPLAFVHTALVAAFVFLSPMFESVSAQSGPSTNIVISEFRFRGAGAGDEFIELFNTSSDEVDVSLWELWGADASNGDLRRAQLPANTVLRPGCFYLLGGASFLGPRDLVYAPNFPDLGGIALKLPDNGPIVDQVGVGTGSLYFEGTRLPQLINVITGPPSYERRPGGTQGHADTNHNLNDFKVNPAPSPSNSQSSCLVVLTVYLPHEIQGAGSTSPKAGNSVTVRGVVTARTSDGFFLQTEPGREDLNPDTSEGLFVATSESAAVGDVVQAKGTVQEHADQNGGGTLTRLSGVTQVAVVGHVSELPAPVVLTDENLERFEGMRVSAALMSVSGMSGDGSFYAVRGNQRPFREPGIEVGSPVLPCAIPSCNFETFDGNPERLRVDADAVNGTTAPRITSLASLGDVTGPLHYALNAYTVLPEVSLSPGGMGASMLPPAPAGQYSVGSLNLGDAAVPAETRLAKAAQMVRDVLSEPDVVAVQDGDPSLLADLAAQLDGYAAVQGRFLVKPDRVAVLETKLIGDSPLFDRPSLLMQVRIDGGALVLPQHLTVIANELRSLADVGRDDLVGQAARAQRQAQAELVAEEIRNRQLNNPSEAIIALGDFNAFEFNDGYVDVVGTIAGTPAPGDQVVLVSPDRVPYDLENLIGTLPADQRYSSVVNGTAQALDHMLISPQLGTQVTGFGFARVNADFPVASQTETTSPERLSDRDPAVVYLTFPPDVSAPVFVSLPHEPGAEATGPDGAVVTYDTPAAIDNLDPVVLVSCSPASGTLFPLGNSGVTCSTQDAAGNPAVVSFTVSVEDTMAPVLLVPASITDAADSPAGRIVEYSVSASDAVTAVPAITCSPVSGSMFPLGTTTVNCQASDDAGNSSAAVTFNVTIGPPVLGRMHGGGHLTSGGQRVTFVFEVRESPNYVERGLLMLFVKEGRLGRLLAASVSDVRFSEPQGSVTFTAYGYWNGKSGYRFEVAASDRHEPGVGIDTLQVTISAPNGQVVETLGGVLSGGNIQVR